MVLGALAPQICATAILTRLWLPMSRLIFFLESYTAGGSDRVARLLIDHLHADRIDLVVNRNLDPRIIFSAPLPDHVQVHQYDLVTPMDIGRFANRFRRNPIVFWLIKLVDYLARYPLLLLSFIYFVFFFRRFHATHFIAHNGGYPGGLYCGTAAMASALLPGVSTFFAFHSLPRTFSRIQWPFDWLWDRILDRSCTMICVSGKSRDLLRERRAFRQTPACIYNGLECAKQKCYRSAGELKLLHVGYFDFIKNQKMIIECLAQLVDQGADSIKLTFVGDVAVPEAKEEVVRLVTQLGLERHVEFAGFHDDLSQFYYSHDLLVCTSKIETGPLVALEAMRVGMPIVSTNVGGVWERVDDGVVAHLVDVDDVARMKERILFFYENRDQLRVMGENGYRVFQGSFTIENMVRQYNSRLGLCVDAHPA